MANERRTRQWWRSTVAGWRKSGLRAADFAEREGLAASTLQWWSSELRRDTRAKHGAADVVPIEIEVGGASRAAVGDAAVEIALGEVVLRCSAAVDVSYVARLVQALKR